MTVKQRIALVAASLVLLAIVLFFVWYLQRPEDMPEGVLVYKEAYMRIADQLLQGEQLCHNR